MHQILAIPIIAHPSLQAPTTDIRQTVYDICEFQMFKGAKNVYCRQGMFR